MQTLVFGSSLPSDDSLVEKWEDISSARQIVPSKGISTFSAYCFLVNFVIGLGVLNMPFAFYSAGLVLSVLFMIVFTMVAHLTACWILEADTRARLLEMHWRASQGIRNSVPFDYNIARGGGGESHHPTASLLVKTSSSGLSQLATATEDANYVKLLGDFSSNAAVDAYHESAEDDSPCSEVADSFMFLKMQDQGRRLELNDLISIFLGESVRRCFEVVIVLYFFGVLWSQAAVYSTSFAARIPLFYSSCDALNDNSSDCTLHYLAHVIIFACIVTPIACLDLKEQRVIQILMTFLRFLTMAVMIITSVVGIFSYAVNTTSSSSSSSSIVVTNSKQEAPYIAFSDLFNFKGLSVLIPAVVFSQMTQSAIPSVAHATANKTKLPLTFMATFSSTFLFYCAVGILLSMYYGSEIKTNAALNFVNYDGGQRVLKDSSDGRYRKRLRCLVCLAPIVGACFVRDLGTLMRFTGSVGIIISFVGPAVLQYTSLRRIEPFDPDGQSSWAAPKSYGLIFLVLIISVASFVAVLVFSATS